MMHSQGVLLDVLDEETGTLYCSLRCAMNDYAERPRKLRFNEFDLEMFGARCPACGEFYHGVDV